MVNSEWLIVSGGGGVGGDVKWEKGNELQGVCLGFLLVLFDNSGFEPSKTAVLSNNYRTTIKQN